MPNVKNKGLVDQIQQEFKDAKAVFVVDYRGLTVKQAEDFRSRVRATDSYFKVYKNTLTSIAMDGLGLPSFEDNLTGPSGFVFAQGDIAAPASVLKKFGKENESLKIKVGLAEGVLYDAAKINELADLPSRDVLIAMLLGTLNAPASNLVGVLNALTSQFVRTLAAVAEAKAKAEPAPVEEAPAEPSTDAPADESKDEAPAAEEIKDEASAESEESPVESPSDESKDEAPAAEAATDESPADESKDETPAEEAPTDEASAAEAKDEALKDESPADEQKDEVSTKGEAEPAE